MFGIFLKIMYKIWLDRFINLVFKIIKVKYLPDNIKRNKIKKN